MSKQQKQSETTTAPEANKAPERITTNPAVAFRDLLTDDVMHAAGNIAKAINGEDKALSAFVASVVNIPTIGQIMASVDNVKAGVRFVLSLAGVERAKLDTVSKRNRHDYMVRTAIEEIAVKLGLVNDNEEERAALWGDYLAKALKELAKRKAPQTVLDAIAKLIPAPEQSATK